MQKAKEVVVVVPDKGYGGIVQNAGAIAQETGRMGKNVYGKSEYHLEAGGHGLASRFG